MRRVLNRAEIEANLQNYVQSAAMPCPYARLPTTYSYLDEDVEAPRSREQLQRVLSEFWPDESKKILAIIPRTHPSSHVEARKQAYWVRYHWHCLNIEQRGLSKTESELLDARLQVLYTNWMSDALSFVGPRVVIGEADIMMTAFNPLYDQEHSRYAPHTVLPVIRSKDLLAIHEKQPNVSFEIAAHAKCKIILSKLKNRDGVAIADMRGEYTRWLSALSYYHDFVTTTYTESYRMDPRTLPRLRDNRKLSIECMESERFKASLVAFRYIVTNTPDLQCLRRILAQNPEVTVFDIAKVVYGDVSGMYVLPD
jgi:hypothetical protein